MKNEKLYYLFLTFALVMGCLLPASVIMPAAAQTETAVLEQGLENQLTIEDIQALNNNEAQIFTHNGRVTFVVGSCTDKPVTDVDEAANVVLSMVGLLGGSVDTQFIPWRTLTDVAGNQYYVFEQIYGGTTVIGGAVKVITNPAGNMLALSSSIVTDLPDTALSEGITAEEAEQIVLKHAEENNQIVPTIVEGFTDKMILPMILDLDVEDDADNVSRFVWVVYTDNLENPSNRTHELPYLAHYVTLDGEYLYCLETIIPGDKAGSTGFDTEYVFEFMEPVDYTGYVDLSDGTEKEITVTVMRDKRTGMYYLGNIERKIVVAKCYDFLYNNNLVLESSTDNMEWDQVGLLSLYNYCRAYDYYKAIGWIGGDGKGTPILILNDFQDKEHAQVDNAAFVGTYLGWSMFLTSYANDFSQCLDIIAHEYTHSVTDAVMTYNAYRNDYGAINEGMSDIQGKICEMMSEGTDNTSWLMGDKSQMQIRSMNNPHRFGQPEFTWDLYYIPNVLTPTALNDAGGVHTNSSLLNFIAYDLIEHGSMTLEEARAYWFAVDCTMVPGTDYPQLADMLPFVLKSQGLEKYQTSLQHAMDTTRLGIEDMPDFFDDDRSLLTMTLPDKEPFTDGNWGLMVVSVDVHGLIDRVVSLFEMVSSGDYSSLPQVMQDIINEQTAAPTPAPEKENDAGIFSELFQLLTLFSDRPVPTPTPVPTETTISAKDKAEISEWINEQLANVIISSYGYAGQDGRTIRMMSRPGRSIPLLLYISLREGTQSPEHFVPAVYINERWYILMDIANLPETPEDSEMPEQLGPEYGDLSLLMDDLISKFTDNFGKIKSLDDALDLVTYSIIGGQVNELPTVGLENFELSETVENADQFKPIPENNIPPRKSRPKLSND